MTDKEYEFFSKANNYVTNVDDYDEDKVHVNTVMNWAFSTNDDYLEYCDTEMERKYFGKWKDDSELVDISDVDKLIWTGFYL